jgi:hypothetical protein
MHRKPENIICITDTNYPALFKEMIANKIYRFGTINRTLTIWDIFHRTVFYVVFTTQLNSIGLSVPHRKHITSSLRAQQVNAIYRFVTMVYQYNYHNSGHY